jgi:SAM-dependent methyltransferase
LRSRPAHYRPPFGLRCGSAPRRGARWQTPGVPGHTFTGLRDDVYRRPLATALERLGLAPGWRCVDVGAGGGDVTVALAEVVGRSGRIYAVDSDPRTRDEVATAAAAHSQVLAITQAGEDLQLPEPVDLAFCRFLLLHVVDPAVVLRRMTDAVRPGGWVVAQEPITTAGRVDGDAMSMPDARHPDIGALLPALARSAGLQIADAWAEAPAGAGAGPVATYLASLTGVDPGDDPVVLPPLVTVIGQRPQ